MIVSHIDTPRLDLKMRPLVENEGMAFFKTHYYGGIKKYQWVTRPLSIHGFVTLQSGKKIDVLIGEDKDDPVFTILDLLPHLSRKQMKKEASKIIEGEDLQVLLGHIPASKSSKGKNGKSADEDISETVKLSILQILNEKYGIKESNLILADLRIVPAGPARSLGFDKSMVLGYGQDDRICAYTSLQSFLELGEGSDIKDKATPVMIWIDKEEIGSDGATGAKGLLIRHGLSLFVESILGEGKLFETRIRKILFNSKALSSDVDVLINPIFPGVVDKGNTAKLGHGGILIKYTGYGGKYGASEASSEFMAYVSKLFDDAKVFWQVGTLGKIDEGGGGTIAKFIAQLGIETIDFGPGLLSMHAPMEISSKADLYSTYKAYEAFFKG